MTPEILKSRTDSKSNTVSVVVNPLTVIAWLGAFALLLLLAHVVANAVRFGAGHPYVYGLVPMFDLDEESNIPTCFSTFLILFCSVLTGVIAIFKRQHRAPYAGRWTALAWILLYLAVDEASAIHELLSLPAQQMFDARGPLYYAWVVPGAAFVLLFAVAFGKFVLHLPARTRRLFATAAIIFLVAALGIEMLGGWQNSLHGRNNITYRLIAMVEEALEMAGMLLFAYALLDYISVHIEQVSFRVDAKGNSSQPN